MAPGTQGGFRTPGATSGARAARFSRARRDAVTQLHPRESTAMARKTRNRFGGVVKCCSQNKSAHSGLAPSISRTFFERRHPFNCFSRVIASDTRVYSSK
jgi:hypothetical protein